MESQNISIIKKEIKKSRKLKEKQFVTVGEASLITGLDAQTVRKLADRSTIMCYRTPADQRRINLKSLEDFCATNMSKPLEHIKSVVANGPRNNYIYARVASKDSRVQLMRQIDTAKSSENYKDYKVVTDIGLATNFVRKGLLSIMQDCIGEKIGTVVVGHADVFGRLAYDFFEQMIKKAGGNVVNMDCIEFEDCELELTDEIIEIIKRLKKAPIQKKRNSEKEAIVIGKIVQATEFEESENTYINVMD